jgi:hypothetical protein
MSVAASVESEKVDSQTERMMLSVENGDGVNAVRRAAHSCADQAKQWFWSDKIFVFDGPHFALLLAANGRLL